MIYYIVDYQWIVPAWKPTKLDSTLQFPYQWSFSHCDPLPPFIVKGRAFGVQVKMEKKMELLNCRASAWLGYKPWQVGVRSQLMRAWFTMVITMIIGGQSKSLQLHLMTGHEHRPIHQFSYNQNSGPSNVSSVELCAFSNWDQLGPSLACCGNVRHTRLVVSNSATVKPAKIFVRSFPWRFWAAHLLRIRLQFFWGSKLVFGSAGTMGCAASIPPSPQRYNFVGPEVRSSPHLDAADWSELCGSSFCGWVAGVGPGNSLWQLVQASLLKITVHGPNGTVKSSIFGSELDVGCTHHNGVIDPGKQVNEFQLGNSCTARKPSTHIAILFDKDIDALGDPAGSFSSFCLKSLCQWQLQKLWRTHALEYRLMKFERILKWLLARYGDYGGQRNYILQYAYFHMTIQHRSSVAKTAGIFWNSMGRSASVTLEWSLPQTNFTLGVPE